VDDVNRGHIKAGDRLYQLKALQDATRKNEYLKLARELDGYGGVVFPHCACDSRKEGHVIATVSATNFELQACKEDGTLEVRKLNILNVQISYKFVWERVFSYVTFIFTSHK